MAMAFTEAKAWPLVDNSNIITRDLIKLYDLKAMRELVKGELPTKYGKLPVPSIIGMAKTSAADGDETRFSNIGLSGLSKFSAMCVIYAQDWTPFTTTYHSHVRCDGTFTLAQSGNTGTMTSTIWHPSLNQQIVVSYANMQALYGNRPFILMMTYDTSDASTGRKYFVNGKLAYEFSAPGSVSTALPNVNTCFNGTENGTEHSKARVRFAAFWKRTLSQAEVMSLSNNPWQLFRMQSRNSIFIPPTATLIGNKKFFMFMR